MISLLPINIKTTNTKSDFKKNAALFPIKLHSQPNTDMVSFSGSPVKLARFTYADLTKYLPFLGKNVPESEVLKATKSFLNIFDANAKLRGATQEGARLDGKEKYSLIHVLSFYSDFPSPVKLLIDNYADVNAKTTSGYTPTNFAAFLHNNNIVELLLKNKADVNAISKSGEYFGPTALFSAVNNAQVMPDPELIELLLNAGARKTINFEDKLFKGIALHSAAIPIKSSEIYGLDSQKAIANQRRVVDLLIDAGADTTIRDNSGKTPLEYLYNMKRQLRSN